jgi:transcriptional regulator with XRE-family HTH domain
VKNRKQLSTEPQGFGPILDACLRHAYDDSPETYTEFLKTVAAKAGISPRHLARLRSNVQMPEMRVLEKLAQSAPLLKPFYENLGHTVRLSWESVELDQQELPKGSTITIVSGFEKPRALDSEEVARRLAENVFEKDFKYVFVFPAIPPHSVQALLNRPISEAEVEGWLSAVREKVFKIWYDQHGANFSDEETIKMRKKARQENIFLVHTNDEKRESAFFWSLAPRYMALYNLFAQDREFTTKQYGIYWDRGQLSLSAPQGPTLSVHGWTGLSDEDYATFSKLLEAGKIVNKRSFPLPQHISANNQTRQSRVKTNARSSRR